MSATVRQASREAGGSVKRIREQGVRLKHLLMRSAVSAGMLLSVWLVGYYQYNVSWVIVPSFVYVGVAEFRKSRRRKLALQDDLSLIGRVDELPSWVCTTCHLCGVGSWASSRGSWGLWTPRICDFNFIPEWVLHKQPTTNVWSPIDLYYVNCQIPPARGDREITVLLQIL